MAKHLYVFREESTGYVKIGVSNDPTNREKTLKADQPDLRKLVSFADIGDYEKPLHRTLSFFRVRGEWFDLTTDQTDFLISVLSAFSSEVVYYNKSDEAIQDDQQAIDQVVSMLRNGDDTLTISNKLRGVRPKIIRVAYERFKAEDPIKPEVNLIEVEIPKPKRDFDDVYKQIRMDRLNKLMTCDSLSMYVPISGPKIKQLGKDGLIPSYPVGRKTLYSYHEVCAYLNIKP